MRTSTPLNGTPPLELLSHRSAGLTLSLTPRLALAALPPRDLSWPRLAVGDDGTIEDNAEDEGGLRMLLRLAG